MYNKNNQFRGFIYDKLQKNKKGSPKRQALRDMMTRSLKKTSVKYGAD